MEATVASRPKQFFVCYCCRETYERGHFRCCAPKAGMKAHIWRSQFCNICRKCPNHCVCEHPQRDVEPAKPLRNIGKVLDNLPREWTPYRDSE